MELQHVFSFDWENDMMSDRIRSSHSRGTAIQDANRHGVWRKNRGILSAAWFLFWSLIPITIFLSYAAYSYEEIRWWAAGSFALLVGMPLIFQGYPTMSTARCMRCYRGGRRWTLWRRGLHKCLRPYCGTTNRVI